MGRNRIVGVSMRLLTYAALFVAALQCLAARAGGGKVIQYDRISAYHHVQVYDEGGVRTLSFNGSWETRMNLANPATGHFEYTEHFHMPWIWNHDIKRVLIAGLGGGSTPRAYRRYYTNVMVDTVEIDPVVVDVAKKFFNVLETPTHQIHTNDARVHLRRDTNTYDVILMDAYSTTRYGSSLPPSLTTKEFFQIANDRLSTNGVLAYNVIGQINGYRSTVVGAMYRTMKEVFPQVYLFPSAESQNIVFIATKSKERYDAARIRTESEELVRSGKITMPTFRQRSRTFVSEPPDAAKTSPLLTDDYAPIESLLQGTR